MIREKLLRGLLWAGVFACFWAWGPGVVFASSAGTISAGMTLPEFKVAAPASAEEGTYLGVKGSEPFALSQIAGKMVIIDVLNVL